MKLMLAVISGRVALEEATQLDWEDEVDR